MDCITKNSEIIPDTEKKLNVICEKFVKEFV